MTFKEAKDKLKELAGGKYYSIRYELCEYSDDEVKQICRIYTGKDGELYEDSTWEEVFARRELASKKNAPVPQETIEEQQPK